MFARSLARLRATYTRTISPLGQFLREHKEDPRLKRLAGKDRGKAVGELYRAMSSAEKAALKERASKSSITVTVRGFKVSERKRNGWTDFVRANYGSVKHMPNKERLKELAKRYKTSAK
jgi:hypothetical protein